LEFKAKLCVVGWSSKRRFVWPVGVQSEALCGRLEFKTKLCAAEQSFALNSNEQRPRQNRLDSVLEWEQVPKCADDTPFIRSLFEDIADWFGIQNPLGKGQTHPNFYPSKSVNRANILFRNM
jgi:hypothetical protein